jgi:hypothetical protein
MSFFLLHRGWRESGMFGKEQPFSDREKWLWLIENASFKDAIVSINRNPIKLKRGQLSYSRRYLANAWSVSERNVRTFLEHAKKWQAIELENDQGQMVITICNYLQYQDNRPQNDQPLTRKTTRDRPEGDPNKKQVINNDKTSKQYIRPSDVSDLVWNDWVKLRNKKRAEITETAIEGIRREANKAGVTLDFALSEACQRGWTGFKAEWVKKDLKKLSKNMENIKELYEHGF